MRCRVNPTTDAAGRTQLNGLSNRITVDNAGVPLTASDITLAAIGSIVLAPGAEIEIGSGHAVALRVDDPSGKTRCLTAVATGLETSLHGEACSPGSAWR